MRLLAQETALRRTTNPPGGPGPERKEKAHRVGLSPSSLTPTPGPNQALYLEKTHETPPSSRDEGLLFLHGLESNPESSLQTPQEA